jgi:hypothetical protein
MFDQLQYDREVYRSAQSRWLWACEMNEQMCSKQGISSDKTLELRNALNFNQFITETVTIDDIIYHFSKIQFVFDDIIYINQQR